MIYTISYNSFVFYIISIFTLVTMPINKNNYYYYYKWAFPSEPHVVEIEQKDKKWK